MSKRWVALLVGLVLVITSCGRPLGGQAQSIYADPLRVAGMPAVDGPSGMKPGVQVPKRKIENTDNGEIDDYVKVSLADIEDFWTQFYGDSFANFRPVSRLISVDSRKNNDDLEFCRGNLTDFINAAFCPLDNSFAWDRGQLFPFLRKQMGDMAMNTVMAHEYGHSIQFHAQLINPIDDPKMSRDQVEYLMDLNQEQQADCFAGAYLRWVTQGDSPRFTSTPPMGSTR
ncbi:Possible lipoprotein peptidase LpqM [Mycobacteroides abscessus]|nr:Possible lipoprotein peptidase LpqM [Mycobacteroides abscessus]